MNKLRGSAKVILKIVLGAATVFIAVVANKFLLFPGLNAVFGFSENVAPFIKVASAWAMMALAYWAFFKIVEKRAVPELRFRGRSLVIGALSGAALISCPALILFGLGNYELIAYRGFSTIMVAGLPILVISVFEEFLFRGILFRITEQYVGTLYSLIGVSVLFGAVHMANTGANVIVFLSVMLIGGLWCGVYIVSRNIWVAGIHHAAWNLAIFSSGIPVSGMVDWAAHAPLESSYHGPAWLTGGSFGPEGSIITVIITGVSLTLLLRWAWQNGRLIKAKTNSWKPRGRDTSRVLPAINA